MLASGPTKTTASTSDVDALIFVGATMEQV